MKTFRPIKWKPDLILVKGDKTNLISTTKKGAEYLNRNWLSNVLSNGMYIVKDIHNPDDFETLKKESIKDNLKIKTMKEKDYITSTEIKESNKMPFLKKNLIHQIPSFYNFLEEYKIFDTYERFRLIDIEKISKNEYVILVDLKLRAINGDFGGYFVYRYNITDPKLNGVEFSYNPNSIESAKEAFDETIK
jgi:hypothetical protein